MEGMDSGKPSLDVIRSTRTLLATRKWQATRIINARGGTNGDKSSATLTVFFISITRISELQTSLQIACRCAHYPIRISSAESSDTHKCVMINLTKTFHGVLSAQITGSVCIWE
jgi:hypothetical protein